MNWLDECRKNLTQHTNIYQSYYTDIDYQETEIYSRCVCIWASHRKWIVNEKTTYLFVCVFFFKEHAMHEAKATPEEYEVMKKLEFNSKLHIYLDATHK